jgi:hypothetical protein
MHCIAATAQYNFQGKVVEANTNKPIPYVSVYVNGSSQGSTTNAQGAFKFTSTIAIGELIITSVGFQTISYPFNNPREQNLIIKLERKDNTLDEILILTDEERNKYLKIFKNNFLGQTQEANASRIKNIRDIYFIRNTDKSEGFTAKADSSLVIINNRTGYKITFTLEGFSFNSKNNTTFFYGYTKYDDLAPFKKSYTKRRQEIFQGSTMQFFRTMADAEKFDSSYSMMELKSIESNGRKFDQGIPRNKNYLVKKDSADNGVFLLTFNERLRVQYSKSTSVLKDLSRFFMSISNGGVPVSTISLIDSSVYFDKNGIVLNPLGMMYSGYWSFEKAANMLPSDYQPTKELK